MSPSKIQGGEASPLAPVSSPALVPELGRRAAGSSATPLSGGAPRNAPVWPVVTIDSIKANKQNAITIGPFGSRMKSECYVPQGVPVIRGNNLTGGRSFSNDYVYITEEKASDLKNCMTQMGDLVFPHRGAIGEVGIVPESSKPFIISSSLMKLTCDPSKADSLFVFYFFKSDAGRFELLKNSSQVGTPGIGQPLSSLKSITLPLPALPIQKAIAHILGTLDDRIELCRRMNETLEAMARALFKDWFIDFGPVRAKMEGREPPGLSPEIAALFPSKLVESELGEIPEGWECGSILKLARLLSGGTPKTSEPEYWDGEIPWASAKDVSQCGQGFLIQTERTITKRGLEESSTKMIPALSTVVVARGATTGRLTMFGIDMAMNQTCYGLYSRIGTPFSLYCHSKHFMESMVLSAHGSVFDTITTGTFEATPVLLPSVSSLKAFEQQVTPHFEQILTNLRKVASLSTLRDTLLPKLLSGELSVPEAMLQVEAA